MSIIYRYVYKILLYVYMRLFVCLSPYLVEYRVGAESVLSVYWYAVYRAFTNVKYFCSVHAALIFLCCRTSIILLVFGQYLVICDFLTFR